MTYNKITTSSTKITMKTENISFFVYFLKTQFFYVNIEIRLQTWIKYDLFCYKTVTSAENIQTNNTFNM